MSKRSDPETFARATKDAPEPVNLADLQQPAPASAGALAVRAPGSPGTALATTDMEADSPTPYIDENGFDPADYKWVPVRRRKRDDGWTEEKQRRFIETLADTGMVEEAARTVGMSRQSCYRLRRTPGAEAFARAWDAAVQQAALHLVDLAFDRAINGSDEPIFDREGRRVGRRMKTNDRLLMFLLRAHLPDRYRHAHLGTRHPSEPPAPPALPLAEAIATLEPATPPDPHLLLAPEELDVEVEVADMLDGELPRWYRDPGDEPPAPERDEEDEEEDQGLGEAFERALEAAKQQVAATARKLKEASEGDADD
ncbi:hypothetical protein [Sphingomonas soli]|uniref:hypothetical protein n=1 Tax=Sphingomonas soli TaxID=266127 RepID=UPI0008370BE9|nr:hypothetical protein [Sphingomonas soli]